MTRKLITRLKGLFFWIGWHPEVALRYLPVVKDIKSLGKYPTVLDVGSGGLGIAPYIGFKVTGIDVRFRPPFHPRLDRIKASATALPFADKVFDAVVSVDTFEHLKPSDRTKAIYEMLRTAKKLAVIAVPCGKLAYQQDKQLSRIYRKRYGKNYHFLQEQLKLGLPEQPDIISAITQAARDMNIRVNLTILDNENLKLREFLMIGWMSKNIFTNIFFRKILLFTVPILVFMNNPPVYRKIFVIRKK